jgi:hypothetical protein
MDNKMINHIANGTTIVPTQPLGFNFLGGKLIACMVVSPQTTERWFSKYKDRLIGITTTGLYGTYSQYTRIPLWKKLSRSLGDVYITPDDRVYDFWRGWLKENHSEKYKELQSKSGPKQKHLNEIYRLLGLNLSNLKHQFERGVFFAPLYKNGNSLRMIGSMMILF